MMHAFIVLDNVLSPASFALSGHFPTHGFDELVSNQHYLHIYLCRYTCIYICVVIILVDVLSQALAALSGRFPTHGFDELLPNKYCRHIYLSIYIYILPAHISLYIHYVSRFVFFLLPVQALSAISGHFHTHGFDGLVCATLVVK